MILQGAVNLVQTARVSYHWTFGVPDRENVAVVDRCGFGLIWYLVTGTPWLWIPLYIILSYFWC